MLFILKFSNYSKSMTLSIYLYHPQTNQILTLQMIISLINAHYALHNALVIVPINTILIILYAFHLSSLSYLSSPKVNIRYLINVQKNELLTIKQLNLQAQSKEETKINHQNHRCSVKSTKLLFNLAIFCYHIKYGLPLSLQVTVYTKRKMSIII